MASDTALVMFLTRGGMSQKRAAAFERWLDDKAPAGIGGATLARYIFDYGQRERAMMFDDLRRTEFEATNRIGPNGHRGDVQGGLYF